MCVKLGVVFVYFKELDFFIAFINNLIHLCDLVFSIFPWLCHTFHVDLHSFQKLCLLIYTDKLQVDRDSNITPVL